MRISKEPGITLTIQVILQTAIVDISELLVQRKSCGDSRRVVRSVAEGRQFLFAIPALPAGDLKRSHDALPDLEFLEVRADFNDHAHELDQFQAVRHKTPDEPSVKLLTS